MKKGLGGIGDDPIKIPTPEIPDMPDIPTPEVPTPEIPAPDTGTFTGMLKQLKDSAKIKIDLSMEKAKSAADEVKNTLLKIKSIKLSDIAHGLNVGLGKAVTGAGKLFSGLKKAAAVGFKETIAGLTKVAQLGAKAAASVGKMALKGLAAGGAAVAGLVGGATKSFANYEQLAGGVETLFKDSAPQVMKYANDAFKTAGLSANEYMETVTGFSASLIQSTGGDTAQAAELANMAITDMADNANKMGSDMGSIQDAYQGFAKQNYTMLDNLKLGYGGTQEEMKRLVKDAAKLDSSIDANSMSYGNIVKAIHAVQDNMGIMGTTALESEGTISGSLSSMKSAWGNMLTALVTGGDNFDQCVENLVNSVKTFAGNIGPVIQSALSGVTNLITELGPMIGNELPVLVTELLPQFMTTGMALVNALVQGVQNNIGNISTAATQVIVGLVVFLLQAVPQIILVGVQLLMGLVQGISQALPTLIPAAILAIGQFVMGLVQMLPQIIATGLQLILSLGQGIVTALPLLINYGMGALIQFVNGVVQMLPQIINTGVQLIVMFAQGIVQNLPQLLIMGVQLIIAIGNGILQAIPMIIGAIPEIFTGIKDAILSVDWLGVGKEMITMIGDAIFSGLNSIKDKIGGFFGDVKDFFTGGDSEAEAEDFGKELADSISEGIDSGKPSVQEAAQSTADAAKQAFTFDASMLNMEGTGMATSLADGISMGTGEVEWAVLDLSSAAEAGFVMPDLFGDGANTAESFAGGIQANSGAATGAMMDLSSFAETSFTVPDLSDMGFETVDSLASGITANMGSAVSAADLMSGQVKNAAETEVDVKINADATTLEAFKSAISSFANEAAAEVQNIPPEFESAFSNISETVRSNMNTAATTVQNGIQTMVSSVSSGMALMTSIMSSKCAQMVGIAQSCVSSITSIFASANLYSSGINMMSGLVNGMNAMRGAVMAAASDIANAASQSINNALKIHSPSRVTEESGEYTGEGFVRGIEKMKNNAEQMSQRFATSAAVSMEPRETSYTPSSSTISNVSNTSNATYAPQFILNLNGASATDTNKRKIQRWVKESINEAFESVGRTNPKTVYV